MPYKGDAAGPRRHQPPRRTLPVTDINSWRAVSQAEDDEKEGDEEEGDEKEPE